MYECGSVADKTAMQSLFISLLAKANTGLPLESMFDDKKCHEAHSFTRNHQTERIFRVRGGPIRVYFIYLPRKVILILRSQAKRSDKLSAGEEKALAHIAAAVLDTLDQHGFDARTI